MAQYKVLELSFIGSRLVKPGEVVELNFENGGYPGPNLEPLEKPAERKSDPIADLAG